MVLEVDPMLLGVTEAVYDAGGDNIVLDGLLRLGFESTSVVNVRLQVRYHIDEVLERSGWSGFCVVYACPRSYLVYRPNEVLGLRSFLPQFAVFEFVANLNPTLYVGTPGASGKRLRPKESRLRLTQCFPRSSSRRQEGR